MIVDFTFTIPASGVGAPVLSIDVSDAGQSGIIARGKFVPSSPGQRLTFNGLTFYLIVLQDGVEIHRVTWPKPGKRFAAVTGEAYLVREIIEATPGSELAFRASLTEANVGHYEAYATVTAPLPPSPGDSWTWVDGTGWTPPIPYPADYATVAYTWDEAQYTATGNGWATA